MEPERRSRCDRCVWWVRARSEATTVRIARPPPPRTRRGSRSSSAAALTTWLLPPPFRLRPSPGRGAALTTSRPDGSPTSARCRGCGSGRRWRSGANEPVHDSRPPEAQVAVPPSGGGRLRVSRARRLGRSRARGGRRGWRGSAGSVAGRAGRRGGRSVPGARSAPRPTSRWSTQGRTLVGARRWPGHDRGAARTSSERRSSGTCSRTFVLSLTVIGPKSPTRWWKAAPSAGQPSSTARMSRQPTSQWGYVSGVVRARWTSGSGTRISRSTVATVQPLPGADSTRGGMLHGRTDGGRGPRADVWGRRVLMSDPLPRGRTVSRRVVQVPRSGITRTGYPAGGSRQARPALARPRRETASMVAAARSTTPVTMKRMSEAMLSKSSR